MIESKMYLAREASEGALEILQQVRDTTEAIALGRQKPAEQRPSLRVITVHAVRMMESTQVTEFKVLSKSNNTNAFGLRGHVLLSREGDACELGLNALNELEHGRVVQLQHDVYLSPQEQVSLLATKLHAEIPRYIGKAPPEVIKETWG